MLKFYAISWSSSTGYINLGINRTSFWAIELISRKVDRIPRLSRHKRERIGVLPRTLCKCSANTRGGTCPRGPAGKLRFTRLPTSPADTRSMFPSTCAPLHSGLPRPMKGSTESPLPPFARPLHIFIFLFFFPLSVWWIAPDLIRCGYRAKKITLN